MYRSPEMYVPRTTLVQAGRARTFIVPMCVYAFGLRGGVPGRWKARDTVIGAP